MKAYRIRILTGVKLRKFCKTAKGYRKREAYAKLHEYIYSSIRDRVFILYGLQGTGNTVLMCQVILDMNETDFSKTAYIQACVNDSLNDLYKNLNSLGELGYKYIFIDEVTLMSDFIDGSALLSDIFAAVGMKIVLSGNDSLSFMFAKSDQLYDRTIMMHTTFLSYRESETVLGIKGIDEYIKNGGTMDALSLKNTDEYINSAIAHNIECSLCHYEHGSYFGRLKELYDRGVLIKAIHQAVKDINKGFMLEVLETIHRNNPNNYVRKAAEDLMFLMKNRNKAELNILLEESQIIEIKKYLKLMDVILDIKVEFLPYTGNNKSRTIIAQPGLRYAECEALIKSLLNDELFSSLSLLEKNEILRRIDSEIKARMMEDIILLNTAKENKD
ncbi:MAG: AAA family ATPase, partial [Erysipelotrichaceae bacterium]